MIGGANAPTAVEGRGASKLAQALRLEWVDVQRVGSDVVLTGYPS
jgi:riboflavin biosynthesis pyrimidine reductase